MTIVLKRYAMLVITGLFLAFLISGVALLFKFGTGRIPRHPRGSEPGADQAALHAWKHWRISGTSR